MTKRKTSLFLLLIGCCYSSLFAQNARHWATYFGDSQWDMADAITGDDSGNVYMTGFTLSATAIATPGAFQAAYGGSPIASNLGDAYLVKFDCNGNRQWSTYYGGMAAERGWSLACDPWGNVYLAGVVYDNSGSPASNLSTAGSHQSSFGGGNADLFLVKFNPQGQRIWATYYGGTGNDGMQGTTPLPCAVACDANGNVYLTGMTNSTNGISTSAAAQIAAAGTQDVFLAKFDSSGTRLWGTYFGGTGNDRPTGMATDKQGNIVITGITASTAGIAGTGALQAVFGGGASDGFVVKYNSSGQLLWSSYYGGSDADEAMSIVCDSSGKILIAGRTKSLNNISTPGAFQTINRGGLWDGFLAKLDGNGALLWGTYFGGIHQGAVYGYAALAVSDSGSIYLSGAARDVDSLSTPGAYQPLNAGLDDGILAHFSPNGQLLWSTYYGGAGADIMTTVWTDHYGHVYAAGRTPSTANIASTGAYQTAYGGGNTDAFLVKFDVGEFYAPPATINGASLVCRQVAVSYSVPPLSGVQQYHWQLPSGWSAAGAVDKDSIVLIPQAPGTAAVTDTLKVQAQYGCGNSAWIALPVTIAPAATLSPAGNLSLCAGDSITLHANTQDVTGWQWLQNGMLIAGENDSLLMVQQAGSYAVITTNAACADTSASDTVVVHPLPTPVITRSGNTLTTGNYLSYQWYYNGNPITGATGNSQVLTAASGAYTVVVTDSNGCVGMSTAYDPTGVSDLNALGITVGPNPVQDWLQVSAAMEVHLVLTDLAGRELLQAKGSSRLDLRLLPEGIYLLRVYDQYQQRLGVMRILKQ